MPSFDKELPLGLSGEPLSEDDILSLKILLKPVIDDMIAFEKTFTEEEIKKQEDFDALLRDKTEVGKAARADFDRSCKENFKRANTTCDGRLDREQLKNYFELSN